MINKCKICGKEFEARQSNHIICSPECRKINNFNMRREWINNEAAAEERRRKQREYERRKHTVNCRICGEPVNAHMTASGQYRRNHYHEDCVINNAIEAILRGEKFVKGNKILQLAVNKGYCKSDFIEIMKERGIKHGKQKPIAVWRG